MLSNFTRFELRVEAFIHIHIPSFGFKLLGFGSELKQMPTL